MECPIGHPMGYPMVLSKSHGKVHHLHKKSHELSVGLTQYHGIFHGMSHGISQRVNRPYGCNVIKNKQVGASTVPSAVISKSNELNNFWCHKNIKVSHIVTMCHIHLISQLAYF
jgi:hypothetical protein